MTTTTRRQFVGTSIFGLSVAVLPFSFAAASLSQLPHFPDYLKFFTAKEVRMEDTAEVYLEGVWFGNYSFFKDVKLVGISADGLVSDKGLVTQKDIAVSVLSRD